MSLPDIDRLEALERRQRAVAQEIAELEAEALALEELAAAGALPIARWVQFNERNNLADFDIQLLLNEIEQILALRDRDDAPDPS